MKHLIVGHGEVGQAIHEVLGEADTYDIKDEGSKTHSGIDVVHICIPYIEDFSNIVKMWRDTLGALIIVHSTVPVGTCDELGVVHSPVRGVHPHLAEGIRTFKKYFGGKRADEAAKIFANLGIVTKTYPEAKVTEAMKLWDTTSYGVMILLEKEIHKWCEENNLPFEEVYSEATRDYNEGYIKLGMENVVRPVLKHYPGKIGGHCVIQNAEIMPGVWVAETLLSKNEEW